jgi:DHA1 family chloramphenicol resistance protein-like MFS transporter
MQATQSPSGDQARASWAIGRLPATLALATFVTMLGSGAYGPFLPSMAAAVGSSVPVLGQLPATSLLLAAILGLIIGPLADTYGYRRTLIIGLLTIVASTIGTSVSPTYTALLLAALIGSIGRAAILPVALTVAGTRFAGDARRRAISVVQTGVTCGPLVGIPLLTTIASYADWRVAFVCLALLTAFTVLLVWRAMGPETAPAATPRPRPNLRGILTAYAPLVRHRPTLGLVGATLLSNAAVATVIVYIGAFWVQRHGFGIQQVGLATIPPGIALFIGSLAAGGRLGGLPLRPLLVGTRSIAGLLLGTALAFPLPPAPVLILMALNAGLMGVTFVAGTLALTAESPAGRATTMTINGSAGSLGIALGGSLGGLLLAFGDYPALGLGALALAWSSAALVWWSRPRALSEPIAVPPAAG